MLASSYAVTLTVNQLEASSIADAGRCKQNAPLRHTD